MVNNLQVKMSGYGGFGGSSLGSSGAPAAAEKAQMIDQVKNQIAVANAQELVQVTLFYISACVCIKFHQYSLPS